MRRFRLLPALCILLALALSAQSCGQNTEEELSPSPTVSVTPTPSRTPTPTPSPSPEPTPEEPEFLNPLTGLAIDEAYLNRRPVVIMINNLKEALPQFGLRYADIIYEAVAEGGITRLVLVMQNPSETDIIGSVRSTRSYYLDLAQGHDGILLHAGASEMAYDDIVKRGVANLDAIKGGYDGTLYYRDAARKKANGYEHSLMTTGERIMAALEKCKYRLEHEEGYKYPVTFQNDVNLGGAKAESVSVRFSAYKTAQFDYDEASGNYLVSQYKKPHIDKGTDEQLAVKNVLVLYADIAPIKGDAYDRMKINLVGSGKGLYICDGEQVEINWAKSSYSSPFTYTNADGTERVFHAGTSYICIVGGPTAVTYPEQN